MCVCSFSICEFHIATETLHCVNFAGVASIWRIAFKFVQVEIAKGNVNSFAYSLFFGCITWLRYLDMVVNTCTIHTRTMHTHKRIDRHSIWILWWFPNLFKMQIPKTYQINWRNCQNFMFRKSINMVPCNGPWVIYDDTKNLYFLGTMTW